LTGRLLTTQDVSEILALTVRADFYDRRGRYLTSGTRSLEDQEEAFDEALRFSVEADGSAPAASVALLSVPEFVPE